MRQRRDMVEHPSVTITAGIGATHFLMKMPKDGLARAGLLTRVMNIIGIKPLIAAIGARGDLVLGRQAAQTIGAFYASVNTTLPKVHSPRCKGRPFLLV